MEATDNNTYVVVANDEGEHSHGLFGRPLPPGWYPAVVRRHAGCPHSRCFARCGRKDTRHTMQRSLIHIAPVVPRRRHRRWIECSAPSFGGGQLALRIDSPPISWLRIDRLYGVRPGHRDAGDRSHRSAPADRRCALFVGAVLHYLQIGELVAPLARRDAETFSDWFFVGIDGDRDRRSGYGFGINPRGVKQDMYMFDDIQQDLGWDGEDS